MLGFTWMLADQRDRDAHTDLQEGRALCTSGRYADAEFALRRGLDRAAMFPLGSGLAGALNEQLRVAHRGQRAEALHNLAEQVRFRYGIEPPDGPEADALLRTVRTIWDDRDLLLVRGSAPSARDAGLEDQIRADLLELVALWAELRTRLARPDESRAANEEALAILEEARAACGPSFSLDRLQRTLSDALGRDGSPARAEPIPRSAHDHYDFGRSLLRQGRYRAAAEQFRLSLDRRPQDFWPNFYLGLCEYRLKDYGAAMTAFTIGIALAPAHAECYFNRAMAADALEQRDQALRDYTRALEQDNRPHRGAAQPGHPLLQGGPIRGGDRRFPPGAGHLVGPEDHRPHPLQPRPRPPGPRRPRPSHRQRRSGRRQRGRRGSKAPRASPKRALMEHSRTVSSSFAGPPEGGTPMVRLGSAVVSRLRAGSVTYAGATPTRSACSFRRTRAFRPRFPLCILRRATEVRNSRATVFSSPIHH